jgi:integrase
MINKKNWKLTKLFLADRFHVDQISPTSLKVEETYIRYLLEWADSTSFSKAPTIVPTFPEYMRTARLGQNTEPLSSTHVKKILAAARRFFIWLYEHGKEYRSLKLAWINKLKAKRLSDVPQTKEYVTYEEILEIAQAPAENVMERRIRAAAVFMYLSGIRIGAFVTLPIKAVDIENRFVYQYPSMGVHTKNNKSAKTILYPIPELIEVVRAWDQEIKKVLPEDGFWFTPLSPDTGEINPNCREPNDNRVTLARKNLTDWMKKVGLPYHSPHKFRHGHVHYGQAHSKTQEDYKAVSQNVMHSTTGITDQFYSNMDDGVKKSRIDSMFGKDTKPESLSEEYKEFLEFKAWKMAK